MSTIAEKLALANEKVPSVYDAGKSCKDMTDFSYYFYAGVRSEMLNCIDTRCGKNFSYMFGCWSLDEVLPQLDTSKGESFRGMFSDMYASVTLPQLDTSNGEDFSDMFRNCNVSVIPQLDTSKGVNFSCMFANNLLGHTIRGFDFSHANSLYRTFARPSSVYNTETTIIDCNFSNMTTSIETTDIFTYAKARISDCNFSNYAGKFLANDSSEIISMSNIDFSNSSATRLFSGNTNITSVDNLNFTYNGSDSKITSMFDNCTALTYIGKLTFDYTITVCLQAFRNCTALETIDFPLDLSGCTASINNFGNCTALKNVSFIPETLQMTMNLSASNLLTVESLQSIVYGLRTGVEGKTLTLHSDAWETLEASTPPDGYETWKDYIINYKGWLYA